jgi:hypothetical protein
MWVTLDKRVNKNEMTANCVVNIMEKKAISVAVLRDMVFLDIKRKNPKTKGKKKVPR